MPISIRDGKNGKVTYQATIRIKGKPSVSRTYATREEAQNYIDKHEKPMREDAAKARREIDAIRKKSPTLADYLEEGIRKVIGLFIKDKEDKYKDNPKAPNPERDQGVWAMANPHLGLEKVGQLDKDWVHGFRDKMLKTTSKLKKPYSYESILMIFSLASRACRWRGQQLKVSQHIIPFSVKEDFPKDWQNKRTRRILPQEEAKLREYIANSKSPAKKQWLLLLDLVFETGARTQEMVLAEELEFDPNSRVWDLPAEHTKKKTMRNIPLSPKATETVTQLLSAVESDEPRVFHQISNPRAASNFFHKTFKKLGFENIRLHDTRHEGISRLVSKQRDLKVEEIMAMVGHRSFGQLLDYTHLRADEMAKRMV